MTAFVVDASTAASWLLPDEADGDSDTLHRMAIMDGVAAPFHFPAEVASAILKAHRRGRVADKHLPAIRATYDAWAVKVDTEGAGRVWAETYRLATTHRLNLYDAVYLELAIRLSLPLATSDEALSMVATKAGVEIVR